MQKHKYQSTVHTRLGGMTVFFFAAQSAFAQTTTAVVVICEDGPTTKATVLSAVVTIVGTFALAGVGLQTLSRSLARGGYSQSSATLAGVAFGALLGGTAGAVAMATNECGIMHWPGYLGAGVAVLGFIVLLFALATGKR